MKLIPCSFPSRWPLARTAAIAVSLLAAAGSPLSAGDPVGKNPALSGAADELPYYLKDRGRGIPTSLFGSFVAGDEFWLYTFYEYVKENRFGYNPDDFGLGEDMDFIGKGELHQTLIFAGWGITEDLMLEMEMSLYDHQTVRRSGKDTGPGPRTLKESGVGTVEGQLRYRLLHETESQPDLYTFIGWELPFQRSKHFIGSDEWELFWGIGLVKGFSWGTLHLYCDPLVWNPESHQQEFGAVGLDYIKRLNDHWRLVLAVESSGPKAAEWSAIGELQYHVSDRLYLKFNCGFGITKDEPVIAPEVGFMYRF